MTVRTVHQPLVALFCLILAACGPKENEASKSQAYFSEHASEAASVIEKCKVLEKNDLSKMSPSQRMAWEETSQATNCRNAANANYDRKYSDYQRRMREEAKKYQ